MGEKKEIEDNNLADTFELEKYYEEISHLESDKIPGSNNYRETIVKKFVILPSYEKNHLMKCKIRTAKYFNVTIKHLEQSYILLNGKKIDGVFVNDLVDRFGFSNGRQYNRNQIQDKYKLSSIQQIEVATNNLKEILKYKDVIKEYKKYMEKYLLEREKTNIEEAINI